MSMRNETENLLWDSIDALMNELDEVVRYGTKIVPVDDMKDYIRESLKTVYKRAEEVANVEM